MRDSSTALRSAQNDSANDEGGRGVIFGGPDGVDWRTPRDELMEAEDAHLLHAEERDWSVPCGVFHLLCEHFFSAGPHPEEVCQRVFAAAADRRPDLLHGLSSREIALSREESACGVKWRMERMFAGQAADWRGRYRAISRVLSAAFHQSGGRAMLRVTLSDALGGAGRAEPMEATETLSRFLEQIFFAGNSPRAVTQRAFEFTKWLWRDSQMNMSLDQLGALFAETRAAQSWRGKQVVEALLRANGEHGCKASWQKSETACDAYSMASMGNQHRRKKPLKQKAL